MDEAVRTSSPLSRRRERPFDGFKALRNLSLTSRRRDARHHRSERRRQDDDDGRHHRQDAPDEGVVFFGGKTDLTRLDEAAFAELGIGRSSRSRPCSRATVEDNILLALKAPRSAPTLFGRPAPGTRKADRPNSRDDRLTEHRAALAGRLSATARSNGWRSACCWPGPQAAAGRRAGRRHDRRRDDATAELLREIARDHSVVVVEHDMDFVRELGVKVTVLHEGAVLAEGPLDQVSADPQVIEVYLGR